MSNEFKNQKINLVVGAAIGGILLSGGVGKHINCKHIFSERIDGQMMFRRGFNIDKNSNILIVEDIVSTGGSIYELIDLIGKYNAKIIGITSIVNRSNKVLKFDSNFTSLLDLPVESWKAEKIPHWLKDIPLNKPGSTGK